MFNKDLFTVDYPILNDLIVYPSSLGVIVKPRAMVSVLNSAAHTAPIPNRIQNAKKRLFS